MNLWNMRSGHTLSLLLMFADPYSHCLMDHVTSSVLKKKKVTSSSSLFLKNIATSL